MEQTRSNVFGTFSLETILSYEQLTAYCNNCCFGLLARGHSASLQAYREHSITNPLHLPKVYYENVHVKFAIRLIYYVRILKTNILVKCTIEFAPCPLVYYCLYPHKNAENNGWPFNCIIALFSITNKMPLHDITAKYRKQYKNKKMATQNLTNKVPYQHVYYNSNSLRLLLQSPILLL